MFTLVTYEVQHGPEHLSTNLLNVVDFNHRWNHKCSTRRVFIALPGDLMNAMTFAAHAGNMKLDDVAGFPVDHRTDVSGELIRVSHA